MIKGKGEIMSVFRVEKNNNYTVMANYHLRDKKLSFKAKGLLSYMLSLPEDWDYSLNGLASVSKEGIKAIKNIIGELKEQGYLKINKIRKENGQYQYEYLIREIPEGIEPEYQKGYAVKGESVKDIQINTNKQNTKEQIDKDDKTKKSSFFDVEEHNPLTIDLLNRQFINESDTQIFYYDKLFDELLQEHSFKDLVMINHYIIPRVIERGFKDEYGVDIENKFGYFKNSILNNIDKLKNNEIEWDEETGWFKEIEISDLEIDDDYEIDI